MERLPSGERALVVHIDFTQSDAQEDLAEFKELVGAADAAVLTVLTGARQTPDPKYFIGKGKAEELAELVQEHTADLVLFNHTLSPAQERNLEKLLHCRVLDRTGLILDIFAQRAKTYEGKLQVELAQLQHLSTRLVRGWTHLERQKGGIGLRGPGETQLETDRRLLRARIKSINKRLAKVRQQRGLGRQARQRSIIPTVSLVGYTNAGKSTLFNSLTGEDIYTADKLFATLDPTLRRLELPGTGNAVLADTVGFIRHLPHDLVEAFQATLEETRDASLLLHVIDISNPNWRDTIEQVQQVLASIHADKIPQLQVFNKIDCLELCEAHTENDTEGKPNKVWVSAETGEGLDALRDAIVTHLYGEPIYRTLCLGPQEGKLRAKLYRIDAVLDERVDEAGNTLLNVRLSQADLDEVMQQIEVKS